MVMPGSMKNIGCSILALSEKKKNKGGSTMVLHGSMKNIVCSILALPEKKINKGDSTMVLHGSMKNVGWIILALSEKKKTVDGRRMPLPQWTPCFLVVFIIDLFNFQCPLE